MSGKTKLVAVGLGALLASPFLPHGLVSLVQAFATIALGAALIVTATARIPARFLVAIIRLLATALSVSSIWAVEAHELPLTGIVTMAALALLGALVAIEPSLPARLRKVVGNSMVSVFFLAVVVCIFVAIGGRANIPGLFIYFPMIGVFSKRSRKCREWIGLREWMAHRQVEAQRFLDRLDSGSTRRGPLGRALMRDRLEGSLWRLSASRASADEKYVRVIELATRYPNAQLGWQLAYASAISRKDWTRANRIVLNASEAGFSINAIQTSVLPELTGRLGPRWREIVREDDLRSLLSNARQLPESVIEGWRESDATFARYERVFAAGG